MGKSTLDVIPGNRDVVNWVELLGFGPSVGIWRWQYRIFGLEHQTASYYRSKLITKSIYLNELI
jgi:hypothetical protein